MKKAKVMRAVLLAAAIIFTMSALCIASGAEDGELNLVSLGASYTSTGTPDIANDATYGDSGGEMTDGVKGDAADGKPWTVYMGEPAEIVIDLGSQFSSLVRVEYSVYVWKGAGLNGPEKIEIFMSEDKSAWTSVNSTDFEPEESNDIVITPVTVNLEAAFSARYVKLEITSPGKWTGIDEISVYELPSGVVKRLVSVGKPYTSTGTPDIANDATYGDSGGEMTDGVKGDAADGKPWTAYMGEPAVIVIDLQEKVANICEVSYSVYIWKGAGLNGPDKIEIFASEDNTNWVSLGFDVFDSPDTNDIVVIPVKVESSETPDARYIKVAVTSPGKWTCIDEVSVYALPENEESTEEPTSEAGTSAPEVSVPEESVPEESVPDVSEPVSETTQPDSKPEDTSEPPQTGDTGLYLFALVSAIAVISAFAVIRGRKA